MNKQIWKSGIIKFLGAQTISLFGSSLVQYAIIWYITLTTSSGTMMTLATICGYLPQILISAFAGVWVDRYNRKYMIMISDGVIALSTLLIAILFLIGKGNVWLLLAVLLVRSAGTGIQTPAVQAFLPQLVPDEHLMKINGIQSSLTSLTMFLSPALSGLILSFLTIEVTFFIDVITCIIANLIMLGVKSGKVDKETKDTLMEDMRNGISYMKNHAMIRHLIIYLIGVMIFISPAAFLTPLLVERTFGAEVWRLTASEMTFSIGAVLGGILIASWGGFQNRLRTILLMSILYAGLMLGIGTAPSFSIYLFCNFLIGITVPCFNAPINVYVQEQVDSGMQGRVFSILQIANSCSLPIGTVLFGPLADIVPVQLVFLGTGSVVILLAVYAAATGKFTQFSGRKN